MDWRAPKHAAECAGEFVWSTFVLGALVAAPVYLAVLLLLKVAKSLRAVVHPLARILPEWLPAERILSVLAVFIFCFFIGLAIRTSIGRAVWGQVENSLMRRIPGYELIRSFTQRLAGKAQNQAWKPALAEIEQALVPAFIIEELPDGRLTVFVPSVPTPLSGAIYILTRERVHPLSISVACLLRTVARWGLGAKDLAAAEEPGSSGQAVQMSGVSEENGGDDGAQTRELRRDRRQR